MNYVIPATILTVFLIAIIKKVPLFDTFSEGVKEALSLLKTLLPAITAIFLAIEIFRVSGLSKLLSDALAYPLSFLGIPKELIELLILKPISGSGSIVALEELYEKFGVDSYISRVGSVISAAGDTIVYIVAVYFSTLEDKRSGAAIPISVFATLCGTVIACLLCRVM